MKKVLRLSAATLVLLAPLFAAPALSAEEPRWIRYPAVSPDGESIAFTYRGQIHLVDADGGVATPITSQGYYSHGPVWSPDSGEIAFASDINGDDDVYVTDFASGAVRRLTWSSSGENPTSFTPDGSGVLYTHVGLGDPVASLQAPLSHLPQLYSIDLATDRNELVLPNQARQAVWNDAGTALLYMYNPSVDPESRQHRVASNARQIWLYDAATGRHERLFDPRYDALNPVWGPDDRTIFYLSEASGTLNVWVYDRVRDESRQLTRYDDYPVRFLSVSRAGDAVFAHNGSVYRLKAGSDVPELVEIVIPEQRMEQAERLRTFAVNEFVSSPDGGYFAAIVNAEVFLIDRLGNWRQITDTADPEKNVAFSPDGSLLVYAAQRDHRWGIYAIDLQREAFGDRLALTYEEIPIVVGGANAFQPDFSPDGSKLAYIYDRREVKVLDLDTGETYSPFAPGDYNTSYQDGDLWFAWSPDSHYLLVPWKGVPGSTVMKAGVVPADASAPIRPLTGNVTSIMGGVWSADGTQIAALTPMYGLRTLDQGERFADFYRVFMSDEARGDFLDTYDDTGLFASSAPQETDGNDEAGSEASFYAFQAERNSYLEGRLTEDSADYLFFAPIEDSPYLLSVVVDMGMNFSLVAIDLRDGEVEEIASLDDLDAEGFSYTPGIKALDVKVRDGIVTIPIFHPDRRKFTPVAVEHIVDAAAKREAAFDQVWADLKYKYYRSDVEGRDWDGIGAHYRAFLGSIASDRELASLIDEMFGEISASHLFVVYRHHAPREGLPTATASLGVFVDYDYEGPGVRVSEVLSGGPLDRPGFDIAPGDVILSVDGRMIEDRGGLDRALNGMAGRRIAIGVVREGEDEEKLLTVRPVSLAGERVLNHQRWVDSRQALVSDLSRSCVVYHYVPEMNNDAYLDVYGRLLSANDTAEAALIDVRSNGGGNLTTRLITLLTGKPYQRIGREDRTWDVEPIDRWNKPSAALVDTFAYSDGSIFPQAFKDAGVGLLVGDRLLNTGTAVDYVRSIVVPGLIYGIPVLPLRRMDGTYYENLEIEPDILVPYDPNAADRGEDPQLEAAVAALMEQIGTGRDCRSLTGLAGQPG